MRRARKNRRWPLWGGIPRYTRKMLRQADELARKLHAALVIE